MRSRITGCGAKPVAYAASPPIIAATRRRCRRRRANPRLARMLRALLFLARSGFGRACALLPRRAAPLRPRAPRPPRRHAAARPLRPRAERAPLLHAAADRPRSPPAGCRTTVRRTASSPRPSGRSIERSTSLRRAASSVTRTVTTSPRRAAWARTRRGGGPVLPAQRLDLGEQHVRRPGRGGDAVRLLPCRAVWCRARPEARAPRDRARGSCPRCGPRAPRCDPDPQSLRARTGRPDPRAPRSGT